MQLRAAGWASLPDDPDDEPSTIKQGERMWMLQRLKHPLGDLMQMASEETSVLMTCFRSNVLHCWR